jgi:hypothetical protein
VVTSAALTLPEAVWMLTHFDAATGQRRRAGGRSGDPFAVVGCAALVDLLRLGSISVSGTGTVRYARAVVYPEAPVPSDAGLAKAHSLIVGQRKPRRATTLFSKLYFALDLAAALGGKGLVEPDATGRNSALTGAGLRVAEELRSDLSGDDGANLAALLVSGDAVGLAFPDADAGRVDRLRDRAVAAPMASRLLLEALAEVNNQSSQV